MAPTTGWERIRCRWGMQTNQFDFDLPAKFIAQQPEAQRSASRLMVLHRASGRLEHRRFRDLPDYLEAGDLLVLNNTKVFPARVYATKEATGGKVELLFMEEIEPGLWDVLLRSPRRPGVGQVVRLDQGNLRATLVEDGEMGRARLRVEPHDGLLPFLYREGKPPLPPYIKRMDADTASVQADLQRYQTVYATVPGAVAAPTAGLHFDDAVFAALDRRGVEVARLTLHVGIGTFRPVNANCIEEHVMDAERYAVSEETAEQVRACRERGGRVVAVGSTSVRTLEALAQADRTIRAGSGRTDLFIHPPYAFRVVDAMITNFHLPRSTLVMMVSALAGRERILAAYEEAKQEGYRFFSYGDAMLLL